MASIQFATPAESRIEADQTTPWCIIGVLFAVTIWGYWNTIERFSSAWSSAQYSHGFLIPIFTAVLLSMRRQPFERVPTAVRWYGVAIVGLALALRVFSASRGIRFTDMLSLIGVLAGIFVIAGGWSALRWAAAPLAFLIFMLPLPDFAVNNLLAPLQKMATVMSTYTLQTMGIEAYYRGNLIELGSGTPLNVEEACSGLRMSTIFLAMAVAMTMIIEMQWWEKGIIIMSAIPIALLVNMIRIVVTALMYHFLGQESEFAKRFFHDFAGWFMIPIAFGFLYVEMQILSRLFIEEQPAAPSVAGFGRPTVARGPVPTR